MVISCNNFIESSYVLLEPKIVLGRHVYNPFSLENFTVCNHISVLSGDITFDV